jgi:hypothetical protein
MAIFQKKTRTLSLSLVCVTNDNERHCLILAGIQISTLKENHMQNFQKKHVNTLTPKNYKN